MILALPLVLLSSVRAARGQTSYGQLVMTVLGVLLLWALSWCGDQLLLNVGACALLVLAPFYDRIVSRKRERL